MDLNTMTSAEREAYYENIFGKQVERLRTLEFPSLSTEYPNLAAEINAAYLRHTKFSVKVWLNYDPVAERFFYDRRKQDCGTLRLSPKQMERYLRPYEFGKVRFDLCTPFSHLAEITVAVKTEPTTGGDLGIRIGRPRYRIMGKYEDERLLEGVMKSACDMMQRVEMHGRQGLDHGDVTALAKCLLITPPADGFTGRGWVRNTDALDEL